MSEQCSEFWQVLATRGTRVNSSPAHTKSFAQKCLVCFTGLRKWTLVASISKNKHCSCTMKIPTSYKFQRMALSRTFKYASPSLFLRRPVFTLILFGIVVCIQVCMYVSRKQKLCCFHHFLLHQDDLKVGPRHQSSPEQCKQFNCVYDTSHPWKSDP